MENSSNRRALTTIIIEIVVIIVIVVVLLFIFKVVSFPKPLPLSNYSSASFPVSPSSPNVRLALYTYVLTGTVKTITLGSDNRYSMVLSEFPNLTIILNKDAEVKSPGTKVSIAAKDLKPGTSVQVGLSYNAILKQWAEVPAAFKGGIIHLQEQPVTK